MCRVWRAANRLSLYVIRDAPYVKIVKVFGRFLAVYSSALTLPVLSAIIAPHDTQLIPLIRFISALASIPYLSLGA
jgi:hypothetical protein